MLRRDIPRLPGDAEVHLDHGELVRLRVFVSPLASVVASIFEVVLGWRRGVPEKWVAFVRSRTTDLDLRAFEIFDHESRTVPNFLMPIPSKAMPTFEEELAALRGTSPQRVRDDIRAQYGRRPPDTLKPFLNDPRSALDEVATTLERYWHAAFEPSWTQMRAILEREVLLCGRALATDGVLAALDRVHPDYVVRDGILRYDSALPGHASTALGDRWLALVPLIAGVNGRMTSIDRPDAVLIAYAAPGGSAIWDGPPEPDDSGLARIVGVTRARLLAAVAEPTATTGLARQLGLAPATVSHHLSALTDQGLVARHRVGNSVYYEITELGRSLASLLSVGDQSVP